MRVLKISVLMLIFGILVNPLTSANPVFPESPVILGILFYKAECPDCKEIIEKTLPSAFNKTKNSGGILVVNNSTSAGGQLYLEILMERNLSPALKLPVLVTKQAEWSGLEQIQLNLPTLLTADSNSESFKTAATDDILAQSHSANQNSILPGAMWISKDSLPQKVGIFTGFKENFNKDRVGNGLAVVVLVGMIFSLLGMLLSLINKQTRKDYSISWIYPLFYCGAFLIAFYLFSAGLTQSALSCGPVGECNTVQQSRFSRLFGIIPVSLLGMSGYLTCLVLWIGTRISKEPVKSYLSFITWTLSVVFVGFFIYLTFLEPFVIGATCIWCVTSAIITTLAAVTATRPARAALQSILTNRR